MNSLFYSKPSSLFPLLFVSLFCFSCSSNIDYFVNESGIATTGNNNMLISQLQSFNDSLKNSMAYNSTFEETSSKMRKSPWWTWTRKQRLNVMFADYSGVSIGSKAGAAIGGVISGGRGAAAGRVVGAVACGVLASWAASPDYIESYQDSVYINVINATRLYLDENLYVREASINYLDGNIKKGVILADSIKNSIELPKKAQEIGFMHNVILASIDGSVTYKETPLPIEETILQTDIESFNSNEIDLSIQMVSSNEFKEKCKYFENRLELSKDELTINEQAVLLFREVCNIYVNETSDVVFIVNKYKEIIEHSEELSTEDKECIYSALATAIYSYNYWSKIFE